VIGATEMIGQARAIGVSVATKKTCSSTDNIRLSFLQQQISDVNKTLGHQLYCLPQYVEEHKKLIKNTQDQTERLLATVDQAFLSTDKITLDQEVYFELASLVIQYIDDVFEHQLTQISHSLGIS
jgi:recombinational DNA repair ATPase RecF